MYSKDENIHECTKAMESDEIHSFLLIGQSNMAGRGIIGSVPPIDPHGMMFMMRNGNWQPMSEPINPDRAIFTEKETDIHSGISLAASFAASYTETYNQKIGLIPCAEGGSCILEWQPGSILFDHAVMMASLARRTSKITGILWHQGESDSKNISDILKYRERFISMIDHLIKAVETDQNIPVILGEITLLRPDRWPYARQCNEILHQIVKERPNFGIASSDGLDLGPDFTHFSAKSYREFGVRYFKEFYRLKGKI